MNSNSMITVTDRSIHRPTIYCDCLEEITYRKVKDKVGWLWEVQLEYNDPEMDIEYYILDNYDKERLDSALSKHHDVKVTYLKEDAYAS